jgi:hypothetical protein
MVYIKTVFLCHVFIKNLDLDPDPNSKKEPYEICVAIDHS